MASPFGKNSIIQYTNGAILRIVWYQDIEPWLWSITLDAKKPKFIRISKEGLFKDYAEGNVFLAEDPYLITDSCEIHRIGPVDPEKLKDSALRREMRIQARYSIIKDIVGCEPDIFLVSRRAMMVAEACAKNHVSRQFVYTLVYKWYQGGEVPAALADNYSSCGAPGKTREPGEKKRGRPRHPRNGKGCNVTKEMRRLMRLTFRRRKISDTHASLDDAYWFHMRTHYPNAVHATRDQYGNVRHRIIDRDSTPSYEQFVYEYHKENDRAAQQLKKLGERKFEQLYRPLLDNSVNSVAGPGSQFEIDATTLNTYVVSRFDSNLIVGRPTLYVVTDTYSRLKVGFYVGLDSPSFETAMMALANAVEDKQKLCERYEIPYSEDDWPSMELPAGILADRGETMTSKTQRIERELYVRFLNTKPFAGEAKGVIESDMNTIPAHFGPYAPGFVAPDFGERGADDYRLEAVLTIDEIIRIVICAIIERNNTERTGYPGDPRIVAEGVPFIPSALWRWGKRHLYSDGQRMDPEYALQRLLPQTTVAVDSHGLRFKKGLYYANAEMMQQPWYFEALDNAKRKHERLILEASHHPGNVDIIYVTSPVDPTKQYRCELTPHSRRFAGMTFIEVDALDSKRKDNAAAAATRTAEVRMDTRAMRDAIIENARRRKETEHDPNLSNAERTRGIRENRARELEDQRRLQAEDYGFCADMQHDAKPSDLLEHQPDDARDNQLLEFMRAKRLTKGD